MIIKRLDAYEIFVNGRYFMSNNLNNLITKLENEKINYRIGF